jgi:Multicopper oxidase
VVENVPAFKAVNTRSQRFAGLAAGPIAERRVVYFDENCPAIPNPAMPCTPNQFFMGVVGKPEHVFNPDLPPDIVATQGTVEQWVIQNRAGENHEFHFHQVHFLVQSQDNFETNGSTQSPALTGQYLDMIQVPYWDGNPNHPYPSVTVLIDFRGNDIGDFVFHCHILNHEDLGMMNIIKVQSAEDATNKDRQMRASKAGPQSAARISPAASAEVSPKALEIADRVVEPTTAGKIAQSSGDGGHQEP